MPSLKLGTHDSSDLKKTTRILAHKCAQIIVQSRCGITMESACKPPRACNTDWFNLAIKDLPEITKITKRSLCEELIGSPNPLCIEISAKTIEGESMVLEVWFLGVLPSRSDPAKKITDSSVYAGMGALLKSLLTISRTTPAYQISRGQDPDCYVICYRIFMGKPQMSARDSYKHIRVGQVVTPLGMIHLAVSYRTSVVMSSYINVRRSLQIEDDHFHPFSRLRDTQSQQNERISRHSGDKTISGAFAFSKRVPINDVNQLFDFPSSSFSSGSDNSSITKLSASSSATTDTSKSHADTCDGNEQPMNSTAGSSNSGKKSIKNRCSITTVNDDLLSVDLKSPFASVSSTTSELNAFYKEFVNAPNLNVFTEDRTLEEQIGDLSVQLEEFEKNMYIYDNFLDSL